MRDELTRATSDPERMAEAQQAASLAYYDDVTGPMRQWARKRDPKVYYVKHNDLIKIGTSAFLRQRLHQYPPGSVLLATEPGGTELERHRLLQFRASRVRGEWFRPTADLMAHIESLGSTVEGIR
jgi:hypothetical protein